MEEFGNQLKQLAKRIESTKKSIQTEEATKMSFVIPFFQILGFDVFNPEEFVPEFTADVGIKKGEKVDYAIIINGVPTILIEAKWCGEELEKHDSQLFRYFGTTNAKFAILTNGINYKFYTDLDEKNKMDEKPFLDVNFSDLKESYINELKKFSKEKFDLTTILSSASELKYTNMLKQKLSAEFNSPSDSLVRTLINDLYDGAKTQKVIDEFKGIVKKSFSQYINDLINDRLKNALETQKQSIEEVAATQIPLEEIGTEKIQTTEEELQCFYIIKSILSGSVPLDKITYKDTESYFGILLDNNIRKWICRIKLGGKIKNLMLPASNNKFITIQINDIEDLYLHKQLIIESALRFSKND